MLWKKESNNADAIYVDLFAGDRDKKKFTKWSQQLDISVWKHCYRDLKLNPIKSNSTSAIIRAIGNTEFESKLYESALEYYNQSLLFAEIGTENVGLVYGNRSATFFELKMYEKCLIDIDLAEKANYPKRLMQKLETRKADCLKLMKHQSVKLYKQPKLTLEADEHFPCMANVLEINRNDEFGRYIEAKSDIDVGEIVLVEENFAFDFVSLDRAFCFTCMKECTNFIACSKCTDALFCNGDCMNRNIIHNKTCGAFFHRMQADVKFVLKSILGGLYSFTSIEELMNFIEDKLAKESHYLPTKASDLQSNYDVFLSLRAVPSKMDNFQVYQVYTSIMATPSLKVLFETKRKQRFLMHLIAHHCIIKSCNSFGCNTFQTHNLHASASITSVLSLINHSCSPNLYSFTVGNREVCVTIRPIKKGDQLFISYFGNEKTTKERQSILKQTFEFDCKCEKCIPHGQSTDRKNMKSDGCFLFLSCNTCDLSNDDQRLQFEKKCIEFLQKFGHLPWSEEIGFVTDIFEDFVSRPFKLYNIFT